MSCHEKERSLVMVGDFVGALKVLMSAAESPGGSNSNAVNNLSLIVPPNETLRQKQSRFARMVGRLINFAYDSGYELTFGCAWSAPGNTPKHNANSLHYERLAVDLNLFKNGHYLTASKDYELLGLYWESIGGSWGGRFDDGNHFSVSHGGRK